MRAERCYSYDRLENLCAVSTRAEVPTLILDDGSTIGDSTIICEYIEEQHPEPALYSKVLESSAFRLTHILRFLR